MATDRSSGQKVIIDSRFAEFDASLEAAVGRALVRAGAIVIREARAANMRGYRIQGIVAKAQVGEPRRGRRGLEVPVTWTDWRAHFFEKGTYRKKGALKRRRKDAEATGNRGVRPIRFMKRGVREASKQLVDLIREEVR